MNEPPRNEANARRLVHLVGLCVEAFDKPRWLRTYSRAIETEYGLKLNGAPTGPWRFGKYDPDLRFTTRGRRLLWAWMRGQYGILQEEFGLEYVGDSG